MQSRDRLGELLAMGDIVRRNFVDARRPREQPAFLRLPKLTGRQNREGKLRKAAFGNDSLHNKWLNSGPRLSRRRAPIGFDGLDRGAIEEIRITRVSLT